MSQYENNRNSTSGHSRARSTGSTTGGASRRTYSSGGSSRRAGSSSHRSGYSYSERNRRPPRRGSSGNEIAKIVIGGVILVVAIACIMFLVKGITGSGKNDGGKDKTTVETTTEAQIELKKQVSVDGIDITGMSKAEAKKAILKDFPWAMKVTWQDQTYEVNDLMAEKLDSLLTEIYSGEPKESYTFDTTGLEEMAKAEAETVASKWDKKAKNGSISSYDDSTGKFQFTGAENGQAVDQEKLASDIVSALNEKHFDAVITATVNTVEPEFSESTAREKYKTVSTVTTKTTANAKRNTNVRLAAKAINGTVLQPGETFSFNKTVGERTEAKGYQEAGAYSNGEVVQEIGGGVCQVSSTLYNAVVKAGLKTVTRRSHTFEPTYVTPGMDATVSWGGPDYEFVNNSNTAIGIRASYADQECTVSIYAIPLLEEGVTYSLKSEKLSETDIPAPTYEEDPTLAPGTEKTTSAEKATTAAHTTSAEKATTAEHTTVAPTTATAPATTPTTVAPAPSPVPGGDTNVETIAPNPAG